jgi:hypothetical protein
MNYAAKMGSDALMYMPCFINTGSALKTLIGHTHRQQGDLTSLRLFFSK